jgi:hypothetical protein
VSGETKSGSRSEVQLSDIGVSRAQKKLSHKFHAASMRKSSEAHQSAFIAGNNFTPPPTGLATTPNIHKAQPYHLPRRQVRSTPHVHTDFYHQLRLDVGGTEEQRGVDGDRTLIEEEG